MCCGCLNLEGFGFIVNDDVYVAGVNWPARLFWRLANILFKS